MQKVAAYLLEKRDDMGDPAVRESVTAKCYELIVKWLHNKGADNCNNPAGKYPAEDGGRGTFRWESAVDGLQSWKCLRLDETAPDGRRHSVAISVTNSINGIAVYVTVEAGTNFSTIAPVDIDPKCPRIVRELLGQFGIWYHGPSELHGKHQRLQGVEFGERLAVQILGERRAVPFLVISTEGEALALPDLDTQLSYDLVGLANIYVIDSAASWGLTNVLGKRHSCYSGAVRIYWPRFKLDDDPYFHPLWLSTHLRTNDGDFKSRIELFRRQLRMDFMQASALCVHRPPEIDAIQETVKKRHLDDLMVRAKSGASYEQIA